MLWYNKSVNTIISDQSTITECVDLGMLHCQLAHIAPAAICNQVGGWQLHTDLQHVWAGQGNVQGNLKGSWITPHRHFWDWDSFTSMGSYPCPQHGGEALLCYFHWWSLMLYQDCSDSVQIWHPWCLQGVCWMGMHSAQGEDQETALRLWGQVHWGCFHKVLQAARHQALPHYLWYPTA